LLLRIKEVFLSILIDAERNYIQYARGGYFGDSFPGGFQVRQSEMVSNQWEGRFPMNPLYRSLGKIHYGWILTIPAL
jgi:hypothetical protein